MTYRDAFLIAALSTVLGVVGLVIYNVPAILDQRAGFLAFFLFIAAGIGLVAGIASGLITLLLSRVRRPMGRTLPAVAAALTGGLIAWLMSDLSALINPLLLGAIYAVILFAVTAFVLRRSSAPNQ